MLAESWSVSVRRSVFSSSLAVLCVAATVLLTTPAQAADAATKPNVIVFICDDLGYADVGCFGNKLTPTPNIDRLAEEGTRFTDFYVPQAVCGASRAGLLTGCYPNRIGLLGAPGPKATHGVNANEKLLSEICREQGYATAAVGKWHLGHRRPFLPLQNGFDRYYGLPYSNDMWPYHPETKEFPALPLIENNDVVNADVRADDQTQLTTSYTERAVAFIKEQREQPFFLYVAHSMPHVPLFTSEKFKGKSQQGVFGDVLMELDWSMGEILKTLDETKLADNTWVIFLSDNGPWLSYGNHAGSTGPLREGKGTEFEGGVRVPCLMRWPGQIPAGAVNREPGMTIDVLPTVAGRIGGTLPEHKIDGADMWAVWSGEPNAQHPHDAYFFFYDNELQAIRAGDWKMQFPHVYRHFAGPAGSDGKPNGYKQAKIEQELYNLRDDVGEATDVQAQHPDVVARLTKLAEAMRAELGDSATKQQGSGRRPAGRDPQP